MFVNRVGSESNLHFSGGSEIIDPSGQAVAISAGEGEELVYGEAQLAQVREARTVLYTLRDDDLSFLQ